MATSQASVTALTAERDAALARASAAESKYRDGEYKALVLDARSQLQNEALARFQTEIGAFSVILALILAVTLIFFSQKTEKIATHAAREEIENEREKLAQMIADAEVERIKLLDEVSTARMDLQSKMDEAADQIGARAGAILEEVAVLTERLKAADADVQHRRDAAVASISQQISSHFHVSDIDEEAWRHALAIAKEKLPERRNVQDMHALIAEQSRLGNWWRVAELAKAMTKQFPEDPEACSASLFYLAVSYTFRKSTREAISLYDELIASYASHVDSSIVNRIARARFNRARRLEPSDAEAAYADVVERYGNHPDEELRAIAEAALLNQAVQLSRQRRYDAAVALNDRLIALLDQVTSDRAAALVTDAWYNRACAQARAGDVHAMMRSLHRWRDLRGQVDVDLLLTDDAFDGVRNEAEFVRLCRR